MAPKTFSSTYEAKKFAEEFGSVKNYSVCGMTSFAYPMVNEMYPGTVEFDTDQIVTAYLDIEVAMKGAKPDVDSADQEVLSVACKIGDTTHVFSCLQYDASAAPFNYVRCENEVDLLDRFLGVWESSPIDVITGWYVDMFDIPYLINRIRRVMGEDHVNRLSPWGVVDSRVVENFGKENVTYNILGISTVDYMRAYRKFTYKERESYRLDFICNVENVGRKVDYSDVGTLGDLFEKDPQKFIDYNVMDITLVERLEAKLKLLELIYTVSYYCKISYDDAFGTVKMWEALIHNYLMDKNTVVPLRKEVHRRFFEGGYVKKPLLGKHRWVVSFDFDSLYPHLVMAYNISSETIAGVLPVTLSVDDFLSGKLRDLGGSLGNRAVAGSGVLFSKDKEGFFPAIMKSLYVKRSSFKKEMISVKKRKEKSSLDESKKLEKEVARLNALQLALKYALNSGYGAMSNEYFLWFDMRLAESITLSGQLAIRYTADGINAYVNSLCGTEGVDYVIAIDTDSVYVSLDRYVSSNVPNLTVDETVSFINVFCEKKLTPEIKRITLELGAYTNAFDPDKLNMKRETIADAGIWTAKKKYALRALDVEGVRLKRPDIKSVGLEVVKSSTPAPCRKRLKVALSIILAGDEKKLHRFVSKFRRLFGSMSFEKIAFPRGVNGIAKYTGRNGEALDGTPQHTRAAIAYNRMLVEKKLDGKYPLIEDGDKIKFCHVMRPNPSGENVMACIDVLPPEFGLSGLVDYDVQFEKAFLQPLDLILEVVGWSHEEKPTLASFF